ncbi:MAG: hypothetical protein JFR41_05860 [Muribaculaceae bacterium]|nr:hypothetical protein [Muribaculaceae bacterium]
MKTNQLNLCELLKGREGENIFLTTMGEVLVEKVSEEHLFFRLRANEPGWRLNANGKMSENGEVIAYPSRALYEQYPLDAAKAWSKWRNAQKRKVWGDIKACKSYMLNLCAQHNLPIDKSVSAMFKLRHLIEIGYGGNPTTAEKLILDLYGVDWRDGGWHVINLRECIDTIAFYTRDQAEDFLSHPENRQLLDEFYMTKDE